MAPPVFWGGRHWTFALLLAKRIDHWKVITVSSSPNENGDLILLAPLVVSGTSPSPPQGAWSSYKLLEFLRSFAKLLPCDDCTKHFMILLRESCVPAHQQLLLKTNQWPLNGVYSWLVEVRGLVSDKNKRPRRTLQECEPTLNASWYETFWWVLYMMAMSSSPEISTDKARAWSEMMNALGDLVPYLNRDVWFQILNSSPSWFTRRDSVYEMIHRLQQQTNLFVHPAIPRIDRRLDDIRVAMVKELTDFMVLLQQHKNGHNVPVNPSPPPPPVSQAATTAPPAPPATETVAVATPAVSTTPAIEIPTTPSDPLDAFFHSLGWAVEPVVPKVETETLPPPPADPGSVVLRNVNASIKTQDTATTIDNTKSKQSTFVLTLVFGCVLLALGVISVCLLLYSMSTRLNLGVTKSNLQTTKMTTVPTESTTTTNQNS